MKVFGKEYDPYMIFAGLLGVTALGLILYIFIFESLFENKRALPGDFHNSAKAVSFHPDSVVSFEWDVGDEYFAFHRKDRLSPWTPAVDPKQIQQRLNLFASLNYALKEVSPEHTLIEITLKLDNQKLMKGFWNGYDVAWTRGPLKGLAAKLNAEQTKLFLAGLDTFKNKKITWCAERPDRFDFMLTGKSNNNINFSIENQGGQWVHSHKEVKMNPSLLEKWIGRNCYIKADQLVDPSYMKFFEAPQQDQQLIVRFPKSGEAQFRWSKSGFVELVSAGMREQKMFFSESFVKGFQPLQALYPQAKTEED